MAFAFSQLDRFVRICNNVSDLNDHNLVITEKPLHQGYRFHKLLKTFTICFCRYKYFVFKYNSSSRDLFKWVFAIHVW